MARRIPVKYVLLNSVTTSITAGIRVTDFRNCNLQIIGSESANLKIFVKGGLGTGTELDDSPNFNVRSSARNEASAWDFIEVVDLQDGTAIDGDTGINLSGNIHRLIEVNTNALDFLAVESTGIVVGTVTVVGSFTTNE